MHGTATLNIGNDLSEGKAALERLFGDKVPDSVPPSLSPDIHLLRRCHRSDLFGAGHSRASSFLERMEGAEHCAGSLARCTGVPVGAISNFGFGFGGNTNAARDQSI